MRAAPRRTGSAALTGGVRTFSWTGRLHGEPEPPPAAVDRIVHRPAVLAERLEPDRAVPPEPGVERRGERVEVPAAPVPAVEELVLEYAEEPLHRGVVRARALARHRPGEAVGLADRLPSRPPVVAAPVRAHHGALARRERRARRLQRRVRQLGIRNGRDRPGHGPAVVEVQQRCV